MIFVCCDAVCWEMLRSSMRTMSPHLVRLPFWRKASALSYPEAIPSLERRVTQMQLKGTLLNI